MGYRIDNHYKLRIKANLTFSDACKLMADMPLDEDHTCKIEIERTVHQIEGEPHYTQIYVRVDYATYYYKQWVSPMHDWVQSLIKGKQFTIQNNDEYALLQYNMDTESSHHGVHTYEVILSATSADSHQTQYPDEGASHVLSTQVGSVVEQLRARAAAVAAGEAT